MSTVTELTNDSFAGEMSKNDMSLLDFFANWCGPCKTMAPHLDDYASKDKVPVYAVDVDAQADLVSTFKIVSMPTLILVDSAGKEITRSVGSKSISGIEAFIKESLETK